MYLYVAMAVCVGGVLPIYGVACRAAAVVAKPDKFVVEPESCVEFEVSQMAGGFSGYCV